MAKGNDGFLSELVTASDINDDRPVKKAKRMPGRHNDIAQAAAGEAQIKTFISVDPAACKIWEGHDRRYDLLSIDDDSCKELVDGIKSAGRQELPALARKLDNDPDFEYEVIYGARRHWAISWLRANNYPDFKYLIEVRDISDEECFRLNDMENRDREDVSDYERAVNYARAKDRYYGGVASRMAERIGYTNANLSYLLSLVELPEEIKDAFHDVRNIQINHGRKLTRLLKQPSSKKAIINNAKDIAKAQAERKAKGEKLLDGASVTASLTKEKKKPEAPKKLYAASNGKASVEIHNRGKNYFKLTLNLADDASAEDIKDAFNEFLEKQI